MKPMLRMRDILYKFTKYNRTLIIKQQPNIIHVFPDQFRNQAMAFWNEQESVSIENKTLVNYRLSKASD